MLRGLLDDIADLVLARSCLGCDALGSPLCARCASRMDPDPFRIPDLPAGLPPAYAGTRYDGVARSLVLAHKESGLAWASAPLGRLLAAALGRLGDEQARIVPIPAHASSLRRRGRDTVREISVAAVTDRARLEPVLARTGRSERQKRRSAAERRVLQRGALIAAPPPPGIQRAIVVDDLVASGGTALEAVRALRDAGWEVTGIAAAAASPLRGADQLGYVGAVPAIRAIQAPLRNSKTVPSAAAVSPGRPGAAAIASGSSGPPSAVTIPRARSTS